jgi:hypothetical protein
MNGKIRLDKRNITYSHIRKVNEPKLSGKNFNLLSLIARCERAVNEPKFSGSCVNELLFSVM